MHKFACEFCDSKYKNKYQLKKHEKAEHESISEFTCYDCSFQSDSEDRLNKHLRFTKHKASQEPSHIAVFQFSVWRGIA